MATIRLPDGVCTLELDADPGTTALAPGGIRGVAEPTADLAPTDLLECVVRAVVPPALRGWSKPRVPVRGPARPRFIAVDPLEPSHPTVLPHVVMSGGNVGLRDVENLRAFFAALRGRTARGPSPPCPPVGELAGLFGPHLLDTERTRALRHTARCRECSELVLGLARSEGVLTRRQPVLGIGWSLLTLAANGAVILLAL